MNCDKCNCVLEHDEEADIIKLRERFGNVTAMCTECVEARVDCIGSNGNDGLHYEREVKGD